jgi:hypothetical protein
VEKGGLRSNTNRKNAGDWVQQLVNTLILSEEWKFASPVWGEIFVEKHLHEFSKLRQERHYVCLSGICRS